MNRYGKLLSWEINRFGKLFAVLGLITLVVQLIGIVWFSGHALTIAKQSMEYNAITLDEYILRFGKVEFRQFGQSLWFEGPIVFGVAGLLIYAFLIWYKEWFGKNTFAYRLLMLPTSRMNVYAAKITAIVLFVLGLVSLQLLILPLLKLVFSAMLPSELRIDESLGSFVRQQDLLSILVPRYFMQFVLYYGAGIMAIVIIYTGILFERSFRLKGLIAGIVYAVVAVCLFIAPLVVIEGYYPNSFYPSEIVTLEIGLGILITAGSVWLSSYLIRNKITV